MKFLHKILAIILLSVPGIISAQYYDTGQDPAGIRWMQIKTGRFNVIYPESFGPQGQMFAKELENAYTDMRKLFPDIRFRIPVIIHSYTTQPNGYVAWAPRRMEIFPTPEQNGIPLGTYKQLALHELTHVMQMESLNTGFSKLMYYVAGEQFPGAMAALLPLWYMEGDAVFSESALSESGRGRRADFQKELKALTVENGKIYKYDKLLNGSYRDYTPDHYQFGYQMVTWSFAKNDLQLWNKALKFTASQPFTINPVNISLLRNAGLTKKRLYNQTFDSLAVLWKRDMEKDKAEKYNSLNPPKKGNYISYYSPVSAGSDSVVAIRTSLRNLPSFVIIKLSDRSEKRIHTPGDIYPWLISYAKGKIVWVETRFDPRWENRNYSVIMLKDINSGTVKKLSSGSRYMSAAISPDGKTIAAAENSTDNRNSLVFLSPSDGLITGRAPAPDNESLQRPQWSADGKAVTVISLTEEGEGIMAYSLTSHSWKTFLEPSRNDLQSSFLRNDTLFYITSASGTDNVYLLTPDKKNFRVTHSRYGASDINIKGPEIIFSDYTQAGNDVCTIRIRETEDQGKYMTAGSAYLINRFNLSSSGKTEAVLPDYTPRPYRKWQHLFNVHSWMPFYANIEDIKSDITAVTPGITFFSQNQLSTLFSTLAYEYSPYYHNMIHAGISWRGWYPVIESNIDYMFEPWFDPVTSIAAPWFPSPASYGYTFRNRIYVPLYFSSGRFNQTLFPSVSLIYKNKYIYLKDKNVFDPGQIELQYRFYFSNYGKSAYRDIYPGWAQVFDILYSYYPLDNDLFGPDLSLKTVFFFPGILKNNSLRIRFEAEKQSFVKFIPSNMMIHYPRSYKNIISGRLNFLSADYFAPLVYPDFNISSLLYLKRIRAGIFYDYAEGTDNFYLNKPNGLASYTEVKGTESFSSFGAQLVADFHVFRVPYPVTAGVQAAWKKIGSAPAIEAIFNIDLYGMSIGKYPKSVF